METNNTKCHFVFLKQQRNISGNNSPQLSWQTKHYTGLGLIAHHLPATSSCVSSLHSVTWTRYWWIDGHWGWICSDIHGVIIREYHQNKSIKSISVSDCVCLYCASSSDCLTEIWYKYTIKKVKYLYCVEVETLLAVFSIFKTSPCNRLRVAGAWLGGGCHLTLYQSSSFWTLILWETEN